MDGTMKKIFLFVFLITTMIFTSQPNYAKEFPKKAKSNAIIETNLLNGLSSENDGLQNSSAYFLGEMKSTRAVIPLLSILHNSNDEAKRINAALSLLKIGDARGIYAIKQSIKFDESPRVRKMCQNFYISYLQSLKK